MTRRFAITLCAALLASGALLSAHEGHEHKVMGTVSAIKAPQLEVKAADGKTTTFTLDARTKILKGTTVMTPADIAVGMRVVATGEETKDKSGKAMMLAKEVRLETTSARAGR